VAEGAIQALQSLWQFIKSWGPAVLAALVAPWAMLPYEIIKHIDRIKDATSKVAHAIARFFVGHSPIPEGPLHNLSLAQTIATSLQSKILINPTIGAAAIGHAMPSEIASRTILPMRWTATARAGGITLNYSPTITVNAVVPHDTADAWVKAARKHADELMRIIDDKLARRARLQFA
jgi:hypothetical protein